MINSKVEVVGNVAFPEFTGLKVQLLPIRTLADVPEQYQHLVHAMASNSEIGDVENFYLTIDERDIPAGESHRRGGPHYDGIYVPNAASGDPEWKTGPRWVTDADCSGGIILASNVLASKGWVGTVAGEAGPGGDVSHLTEQLAKCEVVDLLPGRIYHGNASFIHESLPVQQDTRRQLVRITYS